MPSVFYNGMNSLPDDLLLYIFKLVVFEDSAEPRMHMAELNNIAITRLSLTCHRFNNLIRSSAIFWTNVSNALSIEATKLRILRSKGSGLHVTLVLPVLEDQKEVTELLISAGDRWLTLGMGSCNHEMQDLISLVTLYPAFVSKSLRSMTIFYPNDANTTSLEHFHSAWRFPNLTSLESWGTVPPLGTFPVLSECKFNSFWYDLTLVNIVDFIASAPPLRVLRLDISDVHAIVMNPAVARIGCLPNLSRLEIYDTSHAENGVQVDRIGPILRAWDMPKIEEISISVAFSTHSGVSSHILTSVLPENAPILSVKKFSLALIVLDYSRVMIRIPELLCRFPNLESLSLCSSNISFVGSLRGIMKLHCPKLQHLRLEDFNNVSESDWRRGIRCLHQGGINLEGLEIVGKERLRAEAIQELVPDTKVTITSLT